MVEGCRFMLFIVDSRLRMLPTPLFNPAPTDELSSDVTRKVLGRGRFDGCCCCLLFGV
jgi:hypothetical protein